MEFMEYVTQEALIVIPVLWIIGVILKRTPKVRDWLIPYILLAVGIACSIGILGFSAHAVIQGILVTGAAVLGHQLVKQTSKRN